jgi:lipoate---protein ligase
MRFLNLTLPTLPENLALDEALLLEAENGVGGEVLRVWNWPNAAVVLGAGGVIADDVNEDACAQDGVPLWRRSSGGGTVVLGRGCLLFSLVLDMSRAEELRSIRASYRWLLGKIAGAFVEIQAGIELAGISDLVVAGRKFSGNAQQRKRRFLLHHGTLLHGFDATWAERYLKLPPRQPDYRAARSHRDFLANLPDEPERLIDCLCRAWSAHDPAEEWPTDEVRRLVAEKYAQRDWVRRR